jgi:hypothetical protein
MDKGMPKHWQREHEDIYNAHKSNKGFYLKGDSLPRTPMKDWYVILCLKLVNTFGVIAFYRKFKQYDHLNYYTQVLQHAK